MEAACEASPPIQHDSGALHDVLFQFVQHEHHKGTEPGHTAHVHSAPVPVIVKCLLPTYDPPHDNRVKNLTFFNLLLNIIIRNVKLMILSYKVNIGNWLAE